MDAGYNKTFNYFDLSSLSQLKGNSEAKKDDTIKVVAQQLESVFLEIVLKTMNEANSSLKSELFDRDTEEFYQDMFNQQLSLTLSKAGGIGLADVIVKQLTPKGGDKLPLDQSRLVSSVFKGQPLQKSDLAQPVVTNEQIEQPLSIASFDEVVMVTPVESQKFENMKEFVKNLLPYAEKAASMIGIDPMLLLAQSALETGWGKHVIQQADGVSSHNLFNVKSHEKWSGNVVNAKTIEFEDDKPTVTDGSFKSYDSYMESFLDYINLLKSKRYEKALENTGDPKSFLRELHQAGFATDPKYVDKILSVYQKFASVD